MTLPEVVGIYGGGRMGAGIAHAFLASGASVIVVETNESAATAARDRVATSLARAEAKDALPEGAINVLARLLVGANPRDLAGAELVIEAVPEDVELKTVVLKAIQDAAPAAAIATNTSSLSIDALASGLQDPSQFIGLHFFNPVPASDLVEIVKGAATSQDLTTRAQDWVKHLGKTAITVADSPGFASSRLGVAIAIEAMRMFDEGVASVLDIDTAMTLGYRHPIGPLRTTDIVGLDVRLAIAEHLERELGPRFSPPAVLRSKVAAGELGRKTGKGFYSW